MRVAKSKAGSWVDGRGYRKVIGGRRFELGTDEQRATAIALQIESVWFGSGQQWSIEALRAADGIRSQSKPQNAPELSVSQPAIAVVKPTTLTVSKAIERYRTAMLESANLTMASKHSLAWRSKAVEKSNPIRSLPLSAVGAEQLTKLVNHYCHRPSVCRWSSM